MAMPKGCPCTPDCPRRKVGCAIDCPEWAVYRAGRLELYDKRAYYAMRSYRTAGNMKARNEKARKRKEKMYGGR